jgi:hypothetical protein
VPPPVDVWLAAGAAAVVIAGSVLAATIQQSPRPLDMWAVLLMVAAAGALAWRRTAPVAALGGAVGRWHLSAGRLPLRSHPAVHGGGDVRGRPAHSLAHVAAGVRARGNRCGRLRPDAPGARGRPAGGAVAGLDKLAGRALVARRARPGAVHRRRAGTTRATELRATLGAFHPPGESGPVPSSAAGAAPIADEIGLGGLHALVDRVRAGGLPVDLEVERADVTLPPEIDAAAYRVVQEALTNTLRHAGPTRALARVSWEDDQVVIQVADHGHGAAKAAPVGGRGLQGMRARVESAGGSLVTGPHDGGGFQVVARLPLAGGAR